MTFDPPVPNQRPVPVSIPDERTGHALMDEGGSWRKGWMDRNIKDTACWEAPAGNYVDEVETRDGFYF